MIEPDGLDDEARAELLCYLAIAQLVARARGGDWLRTDHLVESTRIWLAANGANAGWRERVRLGALSERIALGLAGLPDFNDAQYLARLFTDGWRPDYRSSVVRAIHATCVAELNWQA
ncbi:hypothetical protein [Paraburkholderia fungorum]|jgi:hypothetical protein|uniref:Uncharacterized protein n=1 Tax=Paraburkholderia fungorum TaxID=134537 RepID=A0AAW3UUS2_9BURK|nr:hypothetical protein [Paraburkholderia fungorum]MBB4513931.1 hypothetical protein [Paraburkholderia fungorum]MBB6201172.1 hypothetical protein [Paraburkholderia fungorum]